MCTDVSSKSDYLLGVVPFPIKICNSNRRGRGVRCKSPQCSYSHGNFTGLRIQAITSLHFPMNLRVIKIVMT